MDGQVTTTQANKFAQPLKKAFRKKNYFDSMKRIQLNNQNYK